VSLTTYALAEWLAEGKRRFGEDYGQWRFVCPVCGNIAAIEDYRRYRDKGASPDSATSECIGRYTGAKSSFNGVKPCNYAGYGLFRLSPVRVVMEGAHERHSFDFAPADSTDPPPITTGLAPSGTETPACIQQKENG